MIEDLFLILYNATLIKLHLTTCFTLPQCSENIQQYLYIFELIQISITKMQYIIMYCGSQKPQTFFMFFIQVHYQKFFGVTYCQI
jgi:hypothetical protein